MDRMDFEELALKSIDLSMSPSIAHFKSSPLPENVKAPLSVRAIPFRLTFCSCPLTRKKKRKNKNN